MNRERALAADEVQVAVEPCEARANAGSPGTVTDGALGAAPGLDRHERLPLLSAYTISPSAASTLWFGTTTSCTCTSTSAGASRSRSRTIALDDPAGTSSAPARAWSETDA